MRQVRKPNAKSLVVRTDQRTAAEQVDVVVDHHQVARGKGDIHAPCRIGKYDRLHAQHAEHPRPKCHRLEVVPFVEMGTARQRHDSPPIDLTDHQPPFMADHSRDRPVRDVSIGNRR